MNIVVTGSIAFDYLMSFPGKFTEHFLPEHCIGVSLSFLVDTMDKRRGGCAPNIAYTLALLGETAAADGDGGRGLRRLPAVARGGGRRHVARAGRSPASSRRRSSAAPIRRTTRSRRSTPARWPMPGELSFRNVKDATLAIISPNDPGAMVQYAEECRTLEIPLHLRSGPAVRAHVRRRAARTASPARTIVICNDYEFELIRQKTGMGEKEILDAGRHADRDARASTARR